MSRINNVADTNFATLEDIQSLWRPLTIDEEERAESLLKVVSDTLRYEASRVGKDLDLMVVANRVYATVVMSVTVDVVTRTLLTSTEDEPMTQTSESGLGYSWSGSFLVPGGGLFIKDSELKKLGFKVQRYGGIDIYG